jgi:RHS repeat-associated protein
VQVGSAAPQPIVSAAGYDPFGPLSSLTLGNGLAETRRFTARYLPAAIEVPGHLDQRYMTDAVGNIRAIDRAVGADRFVATYSYQNPQYFLTEGRGPWGNLAWSYDRIGNRLTEAPPAREGDEDVPPPAEVFRYTYEPNPAGGNSPKLSRIEPAPGGEPGSRLDYGFDATGDQTEVGVVGAECSGRTSFLDYSAERRLARLHTSDGTGTTELSYDGRGFLTRSRLTFSDSTDFVQTEPVYSSAGHLLARRFHQQNTRGGRGDDGGPPTHPVTKHTTSLFYFAGRPVAQLRRHEAGGGADELLFLTTDHLGVPILATDTAGAAAWAGGLDPFGAPFVLPRPKPPGDDEPPPSPPPGDGDALTACGPEGPEGLTPIEDSLGLFLRFPGQWDDPSFHSHGLRGGLYYNVHRWYEVGAGHYVAPDPAGLRAGGLSRLNALYTYAEASPINLIDPLGLLATQGCGPNQVRALEAAVNAAKQAVSDPNNDCEVCKDDKKRLNQHLDSATYYCVSYEQAALHRLRPLEQCGSVYNAKGQEDGKSIALVIPDAFDYQGKTGGCGCLQGSILHEATHNVLGTTDYLDQNNAYDLASCFLPCALSRGDFYGK